MFTILDTDSNAYTEYYKKLKARGYPKEYLDKQDTIDFMLTKSTHHFRLNVDQLRDDNDFIECTHAEHIELHRLMHECYPCIGTNKAYQRIKSSPDNRGRMLTEEALIKLSASLKGKPKSEEHRKHISEAKKGENNPMYGKHHSEERKRKIGEAFKKSVKVIFNDNTELVFNSLTECAKYLKVYDGNMSNYLKGRKKVPKRCNVKEIYYL